MMFKGSDARLPNIIAPSSITPVIATNVKGPKAFPVYIQKLSGNSVTLSVNELTSIMDIQRWLWEVERIHPDQQRLTWQGKRVGQARRLSELGVRKKDTLQLMRVLPGAYVSTVTAWTGEILGLECDLPILRVDEGSVLVAHKLVHVDWLLCSDEQGFRGLVPRTHVAVLEIFKQRLYDELKSTCATQCKLPDISQPPDAIRGLRVYPSKQSVWRGFMRWLQGLRGKERGAEQSELLTRITQRRYLDPWDWSLRSRYIEEAQNYIHSGTQSSIGTPSPPPLLLNAAMEEDSPSPPVDAESLLVLRHGMEDLGEASVVLDVSPCYLTSREDIPTIYASVKCASYEDERVTSVSISFDLLGDNKVLDLWPRDASGPIREVDTTTRDSKMGKGKINAAITADALQLGAEVEQERGKEMGGSFVIQTQVSIKGWIEGTKARWDLKEDAVQANGLPTETALRMRVRYNPREMHYAYAITIAKGRSHRHYKGKTTLLFP
ncbi:hypothetical protein BKA70DRAFT_1539757 [Coprinopsis sp. MPI-PUGE-AT-0042]|nr:hypothetical protein BKA70DRAFT_1539757 [Coprinopsis sp. MPI-PUGE-AT-0042]